MAISLQSLSKRHIPEILTACEDWQKLAQFGAPYWRPRSEAELERKILAMSGPSPSTEYNFALHCKETNQMVGECSIHSIDWRNRVGQIGVCIWTPEQRRQGYGKQAVEQIISWGFGTLGLHRLEAWILQDNHPSVQLFEKLGFHHEGVLRERYLSNGIKHDMHILGLLATDSP